jgi:hypothetical protein
LFASGGNGHIVKIFNKVAHYLCEPQLDKAGIWDKVLGVGDGGQEQKEEERPNDFGRFTPIGVKMGSLTIELGVKSLKRESVKTRPFRTGTALPETVIAARCPYLPRRLLSGRGWD